jgi:hypothetical protein
MLPPDPFRLSQLRKKTRLLTDVFSTCHLTVAIMVLQMRHEGELTATAIVPDHPWTAGAALRALAVCLATFGNYLAETAVARLRPVAEAV